MEHAEPDRLSHRIILQKNGKGQHCADAFNAECHHQHHFQQPQDSLKAGLVEGLLNQCPLPDADLLAGHQDNAHAQRRDTHAAHLDQQQQHRLSETGKHGVALDRGKPGDADAAGRREQGVHKGKGLPRLVRDRQQEQACPCQDQKRKSGGDHTPRCQETIPSHDMYSLTPADICRYAGFSSKKLAHTVRVHQLFLKHIPHGKASASRNATAPNYCASSPSHAVASAGKTFSSASSETGSAVVS